MICTPAEDQELNLLCTSYAKQCLQLVIGFPTLCPSEVVDRIV